MKVENLTIEVVRYLNDRFVKVNSLEKQIMLQLIRSITSIWANLNEADVALSNKDFYRILGISFREAKESYYWLNLLKQVWNADVDDYLLILDEILRILATILRKSK